MANPRSRERVTKNFIRRYGADRLELLINLLKEGESGQLIAEEFKVSRERVRQWKNAFGQVVTLYQVHSEVMEIIDEEQGVLYLG
jgi:hypothetical protein